MKKIFFLLIIFSLFSASYQASKGKFDLSIQEQEKEMTKYELEDSEFILSNSKNLIVINHKDFFADFYKTTTPSNLLFLMNPPPNYFS